MEVLECCMPTNKCTGQVVCCPNCKYFIGGFTIVIGDQRIQEFKSVARSQICER